MRGIRSERAVGRRALAKAARQAMSDTPDPHPASSPLQDRRILLGVCGGIACYKTAGLVSRLAQSGAEVTVLMTRAATQFVTPLAFESLSGRPVHTSLWEQAQHHEAEHIALARSAELMVIAPATANTIAKLACGICDDTVSTVATALPRSPHPTPVLLAPAMNTMMWEHPITQRNLRTLREVLGYQTIGPDAGWQACRTRGAGRMSEEEAVVQRVGELLTR